MVKSRLLGAVGILCIVAAVLAAQSVANPAFDVASVKRARITEPIDIKYLPGRFVASGVTVQQLVSEAYGVELRIVEGGPDWTHDIGTTFDVTATTDAATTKDDVRAMLRKLLADRFRLAVTATKREGTVYSLSARNPHDIRPASHPEERPVVLNSFDRKDGHISYAFEGHNATMATLALRIAGIVRAPVINRTGLAGSLHDFTVRYGPDSPQQGADIDPDQPSIFTAVSEQLGLRLEAARGPVDVLVIDQVEHPTQD